MSDLRIPLHVTVYFLGNYSESLFGFLTECMMLASIVSSVGVPWTVRHEGRSIFVGNSLGTKLTYHRGVPAKNIDKCAFIASDYVPISNMLPLSRRQYDAADLRESLSRLNYRSSIVVPPCCSRGLVEGRA